MSWFESIFARDEELGKKNDDHRPLNGAAASASWAVKKQVPSWRRRRILYALGAVLFIYLFVLNIPTDLGPDPLRTNPEAFQSAKQEKALPKAVDAPTKKPRRPSKPSETEEHYHDGPIKFFKLAASLHAATKYKGQQESNKNVVFAASSLKSVSELLPLACEMARWERNDVHFSFMGRDDMELQEIMTLNGLSDDCNIHWHDARPDYSRWSSDFRMEVSVMASLEHMQTFIHPQVVIIDDPTREDSFFITAVRSKAMEMGTAVIELPRDATANLMWMTRLDSGSLAAWPNTYLEIVIQAPSESSGSIVRLLRSIQEADYFGQRRPHLTIELPPEINPSTWNYLENFIWPPLDWSGARHASQVTLRHRIQRRTSTAEEASARFVESFYPARTKDSHVLLLSPQVELSPLYYHYLFYSVLEYKHSAYVKAMKESTNIIGISLELPSSYLNDSASFEPPLSQRPRTKGETSSLTETMPFLWQAPNSDAALYFGDAWMELHSFITARLSKAPSHTKKAVSEKHPSWLEYLLELMRARGYAIVYPNFPTDHDFLATVHDELYQVPEEFSKKEPSSQSPPVLSPDGTLTADPGLHSRKAPPSVEHPLLQNSLVSILPREGDLPELSILPLVSFDGHSLTNSESRSEAEKFSQIFRQEQGSCGHQDAPMVVKPRSAADLFCHLEDVYDHYAHSSPTLLASPIDVDRTPVDTESKSLAAQDEDMIRTNQRGTAKEESGSHLARQSTSQDNNQIHHVASAQPVFAGVKDDSADDVQDEFRMNLLRQKQQAESVNTEALGKEEESANEDEEIEENGDDENTDGIGEEKSPGW